jgi:hypothetical protein
MPKNKVSDLITDQEIAFARLVLSGTMTDRRAAEAVGLNPDSAAYTKAKPRVRAYMIEHRAAVQQHLVEQETDLSRPSRYAAERAADGLRRLNLGREQVLARLWEIANLSPEMTRGSITGQVKALSMIVAIEGLIPDRRAVPAQNKTAPPPVNAQIYEAAWLAGQQKETDNPQPDPALVQEEDEPARPAMPWNPPSAEPACPGAPWKPTAGSTEDAPPPPGIPPSPIFDPSESAFANRFSPSQAAPSSPPGHAFVSAPDARVPFSIKKNLFGRRR